MALNESQYKIANTINGFLKVDAGPGTGKTHTIVERYKNIIASGVSVDDVMMITFTNNAAAEMGERLGNALNKWSLEIEDDKKRDEIQQSAHNTRTSTFDALCLKIVKENPDAVSDFFGFSVFISRSALMSTDDTLNLIHFSSYFESFIRDNNKKYPGYTALASGNASDMFQLINKLMSSGIIPTKNGWFQNGRKRLLGNTRELKNKLKDVYVTSPLNDKKKNYFFNAEAGGIQELAVNKMFCKGQKLSDEDIENVVNEDREEMIDFIHDVYYGYLFHSVKSNRLTYSLTALFAFAALYQDAEIREKNSVKYLMVDEFQDTNEMQMSICLMLLSQPNLCVVGDWKQGIYGFRYVSVENLTEFESRTIKLIRNLNDGEKRVAFSISKDDIEHIPLTINYRSSQRVVNTSIHSMYAPGKKDEVVTYDDGAIVKLEAYNNGAYSNYTNIERYSCENHEEEFIKIGNIIKKYVSDDRYKIIENEKKRSPRYGDIAVLFRTRKKCAMLYTVLRNMGIPAFLQGDLDIMSSVPGKLALAWLRFINDPDDRRGLFAILTYMGYTMAEMEYMKDKSFELAKKGEEPLTAFPSCVIEHRKLLVTKKRRPSDLLSSVFAFHEIGTDELEADIAQAVTIVLSTSYSDTLTTVPQMIRMIEKGMSSSYGVDSVVSKNAVVIQTVHKSKGLEYPIVIVGGLSMYIFPLTSSPTTTPFVFKDLCGLRSKKEYVVTNYRDNYSGIFDSWRWALIKECIHDEYDEERRLLFVAISRAKQYVSLTGVDEGSRFFKHFCCFGLSDVIELPLPDDGIPTSTVEKPVMPEYASRYISIGVHDLMSFVDNDSDNNDGKGRLYGTKVHEAARAYYSGFEYENSSELEFIKPIIDSKKADAEKTCSEKEFVLRLSGAVLNGTIDFIAVYPDRVEIHDWKTDDDRKNESSYILQLSIYKLAVEKALKLPVDCYIQYASPKQKKSIKIEPISEEEILSIVETHLSKRSRQCII